MFQPNAKSSPQQIIDALEKYVSTVPLIHSLVALKSTAMIPGMLKLILDDEILRYILLTKDKFIDPNVIASFVIDIARVNEQNATLIINDKELNALLKKAKVFDPEKAIARKIPYEAPVTTALEIVIREKEKQAPETKIKPPAP